MPQLSIYLLGPLQVRLGDKSITRAFRTEKERALLAYLAVEAGRAHSRDAMAELLWPDRPQGVGRTNLRQALTGLRTALGDRQHERPVLLADAERVRLNPDRDLWLDIDAFRAQFQSTLVHNHPSIKGCPTCASRLAKAVDLYRDDFLVQLGLVENQEFQEWLVFQREQYYSDLLVSMNHLVAFHQISGELETAQTYARRYVSIAPLEENAHRQMMEILLLSGRRTAAIEQYHTCRRLLSSDLGIEPGLETQALYERIKSGTGPIPTITRSQAESRDLPITLTAFVGREQELDWLARCLPNPACRLISLVGITGVGKTRLALQAVMQFGDLFEHGVHYVPLESVQAAAYLSANIATAVGIQLKPGEMAHSKLVEFLRPLHTLLVLDHFGHLLDGTELLLDLLKNAPRLKLLVTTQQRLEYQAACIYHLQGLPYPQSEDDPQISEYPALQLFLTRAVRSRSAFQFTEDNLTHIARITRLAYGLPLAIELAAARIRDYTAKQIAEHMTQGLEILSTHLMDVPTQQRSLTTAFDMVYDLLSGPQKSLLLKLSFFESPIFPEAAQEITGATISDLSGLADRSLLEGMAARGYTLHPLLKHYAADKFAELLYEHEAVHESHSLFFLNFLFEIAENLADHRSVRQATDKIGRHLPDIRLAIEWTAGQKNKNLRKRALEAMESYYDACARMHDKRCNFWKIELALLENTIDSHMVPILERALARQDYCCGRMGCLEEANEAFILESEDQHILDVNYQACQLTGYTRSELLAMQTSGWEPTGLHLEAPRDQRFNAQLMHADGSLIQIEVIHTRFDHGDEVYYLSVLQASSRTISLREPAQGEQRTDPLTGLPNRSEFLHILRTALSRAAQQARRLAVLLTDIDQLSTINNTSGYDAGDIVLKTAAERLKESLRTDDVIARVSGDEFAVLIDPLFKVEHTAAVARKVKNALGESFDLDGEVLKLTVSIGICVYPEGGSDPESLLANADEALRWAKTAESNNYQIYSQ